MCSLYYPRDNGDASVCVCVCVATRSTAGVLISFSAMLRIQSIHTILLGRIVLRESIIVFFFHSDRVFFFLTHGAPSRFPYSGTRTKNLRTMREN